MGGLIAETESIPATEGSGSVGDIVHLCQDLDSNALSWNTAFDAAMVGVDYLTWASDPFGGLFAAGVGWLLEHMPVISDVWDKLTGDAGKIEQTAATWENIARALDAAKQSYVSASAEIEQWSGSAADSYRSCAQAYAASIGSAATQAEAYGYVVKGVGALVATTKDLIYTIISEFIEFTVIPAILSAIATSWCTFGGSIGVAIAYIEVQADIAGVRVTERIAVGSQEVLVVSQRTAAAVTKLTTMEDSLREFGETLEQNRSDARELLLAITHGGMEQGKSGVTPPG